jgi:hypothetical protein
LHEATHAGGLRGRDDAHVSFGELRRERPREEYRLDTLHCPLQTDVVRRIDVDCLDVQRLHRQLAARRQQGPDGSGTVRELGENRLAHSTRHIRHKQHGYTVTR